MYEGESNENLRYLREGEEKNVGQEYQNSIFLTPEIWDVLCPKFLG